MRFDHLGIIVPALGRSITRYHDLPGMECPVRDRDEALERVAPAAGCREVCLFQVRREAADPRFDAALARAFARRLPPRCREERFSGLEDPGGSVWEIRCAE